MEIKRSVEDIPTPYTYTPEALRMMGLQKIFEAFESSSREYLEVMRASGDIMLDATLNQRLISDDLREPVTQFLREKIAGITDFIDFMSYTMEVGNIERTWLAAQSLKEDYDIAIAIGRKGMWLGHIFRLAGWDVYDVLAVRADLEISRIVLPLEFIPAFRNQRVLLLENDVITGNTVSAVAEHIRNKGASLIDLFLLFDHLTTDRISFEEIKHLIDPERVIGTQLIQWVDIDPEGNGKTRERKTETVYIEFPEPISPHLNRVRAATEFPVEQRSMEEFGWRVRTGPPIAKAIAQKHRQTR